MPNSNETPKPTKFRCDVPDMLARIITRPEKPLSWQLPEMPKVVFIHEEKYRDMLWNLAYDEAAGAKKAKADPKKDEAPDPPDYADIARRMTGFPPARIVGTDELAVNLRAVLDGLWAAPNRPYACDCGGVLVFVVHEQWYNKLKAAGKSPPAPEQHQTQSAGLVVTRTGGKMWKRADTFGEAFHNH